MDMVERRAKSTNKSRIDGLFNDTPVKKREISIKRHTIATAELVIPAEISTNKASRVHQHTGVNEDVQVKRKKISFSKINAQGPGLFPAQATSVEMIYDKNVTIGTQDTTRDVVKVDFQIRDGYKKSKEMILAMSEGSILERFVKAVKGEIPDHIEDFEEELLYKDLIVEIKANIKNGKTYYNIVDFHNIDTHKEHASHHNHEDNYDSQDEDEQESECEEEYEDHQIEDDEYEDNEYEDNEYEDDDDY